MHEQGFEIEEDSGAPSKTTTGAAEHRDMCARMEDMLMPELGSLAARASRLFSQASVVIGASPALIAGPAFTQQQGFDLIHASVPSQAYGRTQMMRCPRMREVVTRAFLATVWLMRARECVEFDVIMLLSACPPNTT
jgi:hypothetical protein